MHLGFTNTNLIGVENSNGDVIFFRVNEGYCWENSHENFLSDENSTTELTTGWEKHILKRNMAEVQFKTIDRDSMLLFRRPQGEKSFCYKITSPPPDAYERYFLFAWQVYWTDFHKTLNFSKITLGLVSHVFRESSFLRAILLNCFAKFLHLNPSTDFSGIYFASTATKSPRTRRQAYTVFFSFQIASKRDMCTPESTTLAQHRESNGLFWPGHPTFSTKTRHDL